MVKRLLHYQILVFATHGKTSTAHTIAIHLKYLRQHRMMNLNCPMDRILSDIQNYFEYILKKHGESVDKPSVQIYVNKIENRVTFKIKNGCSLELLTPETMKLLGRSENKITKDKNGENLPHLEITEVVLVHCSIVNDDYQQDSRVLYAFVLNKPFGSLLEISPTKHIFLKTFNSKHLIIVWFTNQNSQPFEIEDRLNLPIVIKWRL